LPARLLLAMVMYGRGDDNSLQISSRTLEHILGVGVSHKQQQQRAKSCNSIFTVNSGVTY